LLIDRQHFQIEGGNTYHGYKEFDEAIADYLNEETDSYNGSENHCRRMQKVGDSLGVANADRRREHMDSRTSKWWRIQQRRNALN
jgi:hypothetical protein